MSTYVSDASVLFKTLINEADSDQADTFVSSSRLVVPEILYAEIGNAIWSHVHSGKLSPDVASELIDDLTRAILEVVPIRPYIKRALAIAASVGHPIYDCIYLAVAESFDVPVVTADRRLLVALRRADWTTVEVKLLAEVV